jgi:hypothetical protein
MVFVRTAAAAAAVLLCLSSASAQSPPPGTRIGHSATLVTGFEPDPYTETLTAGGDYPARTLSEMCLGFFATQRPDFTLRYTASDLPLYISVASNKDTTLLIRAPDGNTYCDDDSGEGVNPIIALSSPRSGDYRIYIGRIWDTDRQLQATLRISEIPVNVQWTYAQAIPRRPEPPPRPDYSLAPTFGSVALSGNFSTYSHNILAGGDIDTSGLGAGCVGFVARAPDFRITFTARSGGEFPLIFAVRSSGDTMLLINDPSGRWRCDDDSGGGRDPSIRIENPSSGQYDIWVGTFRQGPVLNSTFSVTQDIYYPPAPHPR